MDGECEADRLIYIRCLYKAFIDINMRTHLQAILKSSLTLFQRARRQAPEETLLHVLYFR